MLSGRSDNNIPFDALCSLIESFGFTVHIKGSHYVFRRRGVDKLLTLQRDGSKAKGYQVAQFRALYREYNLEGILDE